MAPHVNPKAINAAQWIRNINRRSTVVWLPKNFIQLVASLIAPKSGNRFGSRL